MFIINNNNDKDYPHLTVEHTDIMSTVMPSLRQTAHPSGYLQHCTSSPPFYLWSLCFHGGRVCSSMGVSCKVGHLRCSACHGSYRYPHTPHIIVHRKEKGLKRSKQGEGEKGERGLFTAGESERGGGGWVDSDQLHADLQRRPQKKRLPGEREREKQKVRATVRYIWEKQRERDSSQWVMLTLPEGTRLESFYFWCLHWERVVFGNCMEHSGAIFRLHRM